MPLLLLLLLVINVCHYAKPSGKASPGKPLPADAVGMHAGAACWFIREMYIATGICYSTLQVMHCNCCCIVNILALASLCSTWSQMQVIAVALLLAALFACMQHTQPHA
jgi:hypothetical protein